MGVSEVMRTEVDFGIQNVEPLSVEAVSGSVMIRFPKGMFPGLIDGDAWAWLIRPSVAGGLIDALKMAADEISEERNARIARIQFSLPARQPDKMARIEALMEEMGCFDKENAHG